MNNYIPSYKNPYNFVFKNITPSYIFESISEDSIIGTLTKKEPSLVFTSIYIFMLFCYVNSSFLLLYLIDYIFQFQLLEIVVTSLQNSVIPFIFSPLGVGFSFLTVYSVYITCGLFSTDSDPYNGSINYITFFVFVSILLILLLASLKSGNIGYWIGTVAIYGIITVFTKTLIKIDLYGFQDVWRTPPSESQFYPGELWLIAINGLYYSSFAVLIADMSIDTAKYILVLSMVFFVLYICVRAMIYRSGKTDISPERYYKFTLSTVSDGTQYTFGSWYLGGLTNNSISANSKPEDLINTKSTEDEFKTEISSTPASDSNTISKNTISSPKFKRDSESTQSTTPDTECESKEIEWYGNSIRLTADSLIEVTDRYKKIKSLEDGEACKLTPDQMVVEKLVLLHQYSNSNTQQTEYDALELVDEINKMLTELREESESLFEIDVDEIDIEN